MPALASSRIVLSCYSGFLLVLLLAHCGCHGFSSSSGRFRAAGGSLWKTHRMTTQSLSTTTKTSKGLAFFHARNSRKIKQENTKTIRYSSPLDNDSETTNGINGGNKSDKKSNDTDGSKNNNNNNKLDWEKISKQASLFWDMAYPYFDESKAGRWLFFGMIGLTLLNSGVSVAFSYLGKDFWNALSTKDTAEFYTVLSKYVGALVVGAPIVTLYKFQRERLAVHWREWMTDRTLQLYSTNRVYYSLERGREIDNPDQRIAEDVESFTGYSLQLFITIVTSVIDLVSFSLILYSIYPQLFIAIILYATFGTVTTTWLGKDLVRLNYDQLQKEADFRYSLVRLRENAESIAFYAGEDLEGQAIQKRLQKVISNKRDINVAQRNLEFFTNGYRFMIQLLPVTVVAPRYFVGEIGLGVISQSVGAFNHILNDLSIIVNQFERLSRFSAGIDRLSQFLEEIRTADLQRNDTSPLLVLANATDVTETATFTTTTTGSSSSSVDTTRVSSQVEQTNGASTEFGKINLQQLPTVNGDYEKMAATTANNILSISGLDLVTPDKKRVLIRDLTMFLKEGENLLIVGNSGAGKSSLLRAIAGLWTDGNGQIIRPSDEDVYFLPQRPYCTLGSLKDQLLYPSIDSLNTDDYPEGHVFSPSHLLKQSLTDEDLLQVLEQVDLKELPLRAGDGDPKRGLQTVLDWSNTLSLGEQQRLAFGRVLVNRPRLVILDEATSALDMVAEAKMYSLLQNMAQKTLSKDGKIMSAPGLTYISVGHRPSLLAYHDQRLRLGGENEHSIEEIEKSSSFNLEQQQVSNL